MKHEQYLIDTHAHLEDETYKNDVDAVIGRAEAAGVKKIISAGINSRSSQYNIGLAKKYKGRVFASYGVHPHDAAEFSQKSLDELEYAFKNREVVAGGEIGLDYFKDLSPRDKQKTAFIAQLEITAKYKMPAILHLRDAFDDFKKLTEGIDLRGVFHCYSGDAAFAEWALAKGYFFSFTASITYPLKEIYKEVSKNRDTARRVSAYEILRSPGNRPKIPESVAAIFRTIPIGRIMVETDCPYMAPHPHRGKRNEPAYVSYVAECVAGIMDMDLGEFIEKTSRNAEGFFGI